MKVKINSKGQIKGTPIKDMKRGDFGFVVAGNYSFNGALVYKTHGGNVEIIGHHSGVDCWTPPFTGNLVQVRLLDPGETITIKREGDIL